jgi:hypothetical protein
MRRTHYLTRVFFSFGITSAHHVVRDHLLSVVCFSAIFVGHDGNVHLAQLATGFAVFLRRSPAGRSADFASVQLLYKYQSVCTWHQHHEQGKIEKFNFTTSLIIA